MDLKLYDMYQRTCPQSGAELEQGCPPLGDCVSLSAGRAEFASFQAVLGPFDGKPGASTATVKAGDLTGPGGAKISAGQFDLFAQWYSWSGTPPTPRRAKAPVQIGPAAEHYVPDGLIPLEAFGGRLPLGLPGNDVPKQRYQGLWVDLFVPPGAKPGRYEGRLTVEADGEIHDVPVALDVDAFISPEKVGFTFLMNNYADSISGGWSDLKGDLDRHHTRRYRDIERTFWRLARDHRCVFYYLPYTHSGYVFPTFAPELTGGGPNKRVKSWAEFDRHFAGYFDGSAFKGCRRGNLPVERFFLPISLDWPASFLKYGRPGYADEFRAVGRQMADHFKAKGWTRTAFDAFLNHKQRFKLYPWDCEEVRFPEDNEVHRAFRTMWEGTLDHRTTRPVRFDYTIGDTWIVEDDMHNDLSEFIDVFICQSRTTARQPQRTRELQARGTHFCLCGGGATIADSLRATAFWPVQFWMWNADSFMVWLSMGWGEDPWHGELVGGGRTLFMYPGERFGLDAALPSLRLKLVRNVLQTLERLDARAKALGGGREKVADLVSAAMGIAPDGWLPRPQKDWTGSVEPPIANWEQTTVAGFRALADRAVLPDAR